MSKPRVQRSYDFTIPTSLRVELHEYGCTCRHCMPEQPMSHRTIAAILSAGFIVANGIAFAIDPAGMVDVFRSMVGL